MSSFDVIENGWLAAPEVEAEAVSQCCVCAEPICSGDICCECMENMTAAAFLTDVCCERENIAKRD